MRVITLVVWVETQRPNKVMTGVVWRSHSARARRQKYPSNRENSALKGVIHNIPVGLPPLRQIKPNLERAEGINHSRGGF